MSDLETIVDRFEIEALRGEFTDALMMRDYDRFASLFTEDGVWRIPGGGIEFAGRADIRAGIERLQANWAYFVQVTHAGTIRVENGRAVGRAYMAELGTFHEGGSHTNYAIYHDCYRSTPEGWRFTERVYEVLYVDTTTLAGSGSRAEQRPQL
ncbi:nuclear transport factor 2 family protein [Streptomyces sp. NPDC050658]|uniref:nuclear transport factor 2 family protein n=1 Tax=unclassified Streptomyces TaxID=2593676 RepID=UPI00341E61C3